jgi:S-disulfanyl-L-cysteine oxidoreductase SoxD
MNSAARERRDKRLRNRLLGTVGAGLLAAGVLWCAGGAHAKGVLPQEAPSPESRSVWDGVFTEEQAKRGQPLYKKECATCHADTLIGGGGAAALTGGTFLSNWNGLTLGDLFDRIRKTMPQSDPGRLTRQQDADILAYILSFNKFPAGKTELPRQTEFLREIRFEATKPDTKQ